MILLCLVILLIGIVVFFHYLQGFFSATISAICAVIAAVFAFSYHERIVESLLGGKMADNAHAMVLLALFAAIYLVLRIVFDKLVSGNIRVPVIADKIGAVLMGIVTGIFAAGILVIAAQEMPLGITVAGHGVYKLKEEHSIIGLRRGIGNAIDVKVWDELDSNTPGEFKEEDRTPLAVPVDDVVVGLVDHLSSDHGSLSTGDSLAHIHPDFVQELFGQRLGIETGNVKHVALNLDNKGLHGIKLLGVYSIDNIPAENQKDPEFSKIRTTMKPVTLAHGDGFLVVRVLITHVAADEDFLFRFSPGAARLVVPQRASVESGSTWHNVYPLGTLDHGTVLYLDKPDDYLFVNLKEKDRAIDLVYQLKNAAQFEKKMPAGSFFELKRLGRIDLSGSEVLPYANRKSADDEFVEVMRKDYVLHPEKDPAMQQRAAPPPVVTAPPPVTPTPPPASQPPLQYRDAIASATLPYPVTVDAGPPDRPSVVVPGGTTTLQGGKIASINMDSGQAEQNLAMKITQFSVPAGQVMVKLTGTPSSAAPWAFFTQPDQIELVDTTGKHYQPFGLFALYDAGGAERIHYLYTSAAPLSGTSAQQGTPKEAALFYLVPEGTTFNALFEKGQKVQDLNVGPVKQ